MTGTLTQFDPTSPVHKKFVMDTLRREFEVMKVALREDNARAFVTIYVGRHERKMRSSGFFSVSRGALSEYEIRDVIRGIVAEVATQFSNTQAGVGLRAALLLISEITIDMIHELSRNTGRVKDPWDDEKPLPKTPKQSGNTPRKKAQKSG